MARFLSVLAFVAAIFGAGFAVAGVAAPAATAQPCGGANVWGFGGSRCDGPFYQDGSFQRCESLMLFGIGGWNCYIVPAPPPPAVPLPA